ncbi:oligoendopeptidase F [Ideonella azotifigens]|uniref:Oligopeptidase F n=1 Tax=Ideonella azotifigens TaxID=513160 RepID=A0ABN1JQJ6_9BURK|nr:oligoendopeptidase F [Ideonella azotifigens]
MPRRPPLLRTLCATAAVLALSAAAFPGLAAEGDKPATRVRGEIPAEYRWDFTAIYANWAAWDADMQRMEALMADFGKLQGSLKKGPAALLKAYQTMDEIGKLQTKLYAYPQLQKDADGRDQEVAGRFQRALAVFARFDAASAWFQPELLTLPQAKVKGWLAATPALKPYAFGITDSFRKQAHVLDAKGEQLLSLAGPVGRASMNAYDELSTSDIKFPTITTSDGQSVLLSPGNYQGLLSKNANQADRAKAAAAHVGTYGAQANTYAAIYAGILQRDWFNAQARKFPTTLDAALSDNNVPRSVVETLVATTRAGTAPLQRYARLRKQLMGLGEYHLYDSSRPLFASSESYPYKKALGLVLESVAPLGEDYVQRYKKFMTGGRIDVYENEGKRSGAYSAGVYGVGPFQLLNYNDTMDAAFVLAHEGGHAMHTVLAYETQPYSTAEYTIFVAEVASTTNERFLLETLLKKTTDPKERFLLLQHAVDSIIGTFYTQVLFADFELQAHQLVEKGEPVTTEVLNKLYAGLLKTYYGDAVTVDDFYQWTWARIPHFFHSPYYVYQYATCFASSAQLFKGMTTGTEEAKKAATARYLNMLKAGGSDHPMAELKQAGVDLTQRATVQAVVDQLDALVSQMEVEAAKIPR